MCEAFARVAVALFCQVLLQGLDVIVRLLRHDGFQLHEQVTALTGLVHQAMALGTHALAILAAGRHLEVDLAGQGRRGDFGTQLL